MKISLQVVSCDDAGMMTSLKACCYAATRKLQQHIASYCKQTIYIIVGSTSYKDLLDVITAISFFSVPVMLMFQL